MARILLIEDSPTDTAVLTQLLERNGHDVLSSGSAEDGIEVCRREKPDLVLMDVVLPGMNGFQATRALSRDAITKAIPVLIVSTKGMDADKAWGMRQGARDYIVKPVNGDELFAKIKAFAEANEGRPWILGRGWHQEKWASVPQPSARIARPASSPRRSRRWATAWPSSKVLKTPPFQSSEMLFASASQRR